VKPFYATDCRYEPESGEASASHMKRQSSAGFWASAAAIWSYGMAQDLMIQNGEARIWSAIFVCSGSTCDGINGR
jgi:hypothetical protein